MAWETLSHGLADLVTWPGRPCHMAWETLSHEECPAWPGRPCHMQWCDIIISRHTRGRARQRILKAVHGLGIRTLARHHLHSSFSVHSEVITIKLILMVRNCHHPLSLPSPPLPPSPPCVCPLSTWCHCIRQDLPGLPSPLCTLQVIISWSQWRPWNEAIPCRHHTQGCPCPGQGSLPQFWLLQLTEGVWWPEGGCYISCFHPCMPTVWSNWQ